MRRVALFVALRQLWARRVLNGIATLGVMLGVLVLICMSGMLRGFQLKFLNSILKISPDVVVLDTKLGATQTILETHYTSVAASVSHQTPSDRKRRIARPQQTLAALEDVPGVQAAAASLDGSAVLAFVGRQYPVELRGIDPGAQDRVTPISQFMVGGDFQALAATQDAILLGSDVAKKLGAKVGDVVTCGATLGPRLRLEVVGIYESGIPAIDASRVYVTLRDAQVLLARPDVVSRVEMRLERHEDAPGVAAAVERMLGYDAESWQEANANFLALFEQQNSIVKFVISAILCVGGFGILAVQIMLVFQKTRDIALLRSIGFTPPDVLSIFMLQGAIVALAGGSMGSLIGHQILEFLSHQKAPMDGMVKSDMFLVHDDPNMYWYGIGFALLVGQLASLVPALRAARLEPVDVLRGQIG